MYVLRFFNLLFVIISFSFVPVLSSCIASDNHNSYAQTLKAGLRVGAERTEVYIGLLDTKRVAVVGNHSSLVSGVHLVDTLLRLGINVVKVFGPEHGFRGDLPDGETVASGVDPTTGIEIVSLYGKYRKPNPNHLKNVDIIVFDMQDVGVRFYTYISTMSLVMEAAAENGIPVLVLDRPNPHRHYIDGPVLEPGYSSFVGMHQVPVVYGMTIGEYALMVNGQGWLANGVKCNLKVIAIENYFSDTKYIFPVPPSPNLPNMRSVYLYPSLCFFEGTLISVGRGTDFPFEVFGHPKLPSEKYTFSFQPKITSASTNPPLLGQLCNGLSLKHLTEDYYKSVRSINLDYLLEGYSDYPEKAYFFNNYFNRLAGTASLQEQIKNGVAESAIRASWQPRIEEFRQIRSKYLLYCDFR